MSIAKQEFTDAGKSMLGRAQNGETLTITQIVVGDGVASQPSDLWPLTNLIDHKMDVTMSTKNDYGNGTMLVEGSFTSDQAAAAFYLREIGVLAHIGTEADRLYSVANVLTDPPDYIDPAAPTVQAFKIKLVIDRIPTANVIVQIGASENVIGSNIGADTVGPGWYHDALGNVLNFKRIVQGTGMDIHDSTDGNSVYVGVKTLTVDLDLYVPLTYPGINDPNVLFPTIQAAHDYLLQYIIPSNRQARIHVAAGTLHNNGVTFIHPNSSQIRLLGQLPRQDKAVTRIDYVSATQKKVTCDTTGLVVGQRVYIANSQGYSGGCVIQSIGTGNVLCSIPNRGTRPAYTTSDLSAGLRMSWFPTVIICDNAGVSAFNFNNGIGLVQGLTVDGGTTGITTFGNSIIQDCWARGGGTSGRCFSFAGGTLTLQGEVIATDTASGFFGSGALTATYGTFFANGCQHGFATEAGGGPFNVGATAASLGSTSVYLSHCSTGFYAAVGGQIRCDQVYFDTNDSGWVAQFNGVIVAGIYFASHPVNNGTDLWATDGSYIYYGRLGAAVPTCSPVAETNGNQNSFIHVA